MGLELFLGQRILTGNKVGYKSSTKRIKDPNVGFGAGQGPTCVDVDFDVKVHFRLPKFLVRSLPDLKWPKYPASGVSY